ncbi:MAG TPA: CHAD domain-containing protein [Myxococcota bacterium]|nr:CHAD domain-containing protein [Myxococcota bacterium]
MSDAPKSEDARSAARPGSGREVELKLEVPTGDLAALRRHPLVRELATKRSPARRLHTVYYDTADHDLERERLALRVRSIGRAHVQALKSDSASTGGLFVRGEWEARLPGPEPDLERIPDFASRARARAAVGEKPLLPVFETDFRRSAVLLAKGDDEVELAFDEGEIRARGATLPIRELELELVRGDPGVLYGIALELHEALPLRPAVQSKAERGYALATGQRPGPRRARRVELASDATLEQALAAVLGACLEHVLANHEPARDGGDPEGVHQLRVALRRTRAALALFRDVLPADQVRPFKAELGWLADRLGPARDLDVFLSETLEPLAARAPGDPGLKRLRDAARELRDEAYAAVREAVDAPRASALALALGGWMAARGWREGASAEALAALAAPARGAATELLERRHRKARRLGRDLPERSVEERHQLRIELKKLRYAGEFLRALFPEARVERTLKQLSRLQDTLGHLNDVATMERQLDGIADVLGAEWGPKQQRAAGFVAGWTALLAEHRLAELDKQWKDFRRSAPFWVT